MSYDVLITFTLASTTLALLPGPDNIFVLIQSITNTTKQGLATVLGLVTGCLIHTLLVAFGIATLIKNNPSLLVSIKLLGAGYLIYLAYKVYNSKRKINLNTKSTKQSVKSLFKQGFIMNVLNPKVSLFFIAFFPGFIFSNQLSLTTQFFVLGLIFISVTFFVFAIIAILAGKISTYLSAKSGILNHLKWVQIIVFISIALLILI